MKYLVLLLCFAFVGCSSMAFKKLEHNVQGPKIEEQLTVGVGGEFFYWERMLGTFNIDGSIMHGSADRFDLRVKSVNDKKIVLDYAEYFKTPINGSGTYDKDGSWSIKPGFNKSLEFDLTSTKRFNYENFEFEVTKIEPNKVTYKRTK